MALGGALRLLRSGEAYRWLGYVRLGDYLAERLGVSLRTAQELMRTDEALARLPLISAAFRDGKITSAHVRLLTRVASTEDEAFWLSRARWMDVRRLSRAVAAEVRRKGGEQSAVGPSGTSGSACDTTDPFDEPDRVPLEIHAPAWLSRWWRETVVLVGRLVGRALGPGECLEVVLSESASGSGAVLAGYGECVEAGATSSPEAAMDHVAEAEASSSHGQASERPEDPGAALDGERSQAATGNRALPEGDARHAAHALDGTLSDLVASRQREEAELADHLVRVRAEGAYLDAQCRSLEEYAREQLGISPRQMYYLLSLHRTLERLPDVARVFVAGRLTLRQVLLCGRVATTATAGAWLRRAEGIALRRLEDEVGFWELLREERPEVWGLLEGGPIPEGIVLVPGKAPRLHESACGAASPLESDDGAQSGDVHLRGSACGCRPTSVGEDVKGCARQELHDSASRDSDTHGLSEPPKCDSSDLHGCAPLASVGAGALLAALQADERALPLPDRRCRIKMWTDLDTRRAWSASVAAFRSRATEPLEEWEVLVLHLREFWSVWDNKQTQKQRREHATVERDGWRCTAPGCRSVGTGRLHEHHIEFRSHGGELTDPGNLTTLCRGHHLGLLHENKMRCTGMAPDRLLWEYGVARGENAFLVFRDEHRIGGTAV